MFNFDGTVGERLANYDNLRDYEKLTILGQANHTQECRAIENGVLEAIDNRDRGSHGVVAIINDIAILYYGHGFVDAHYTVCIQNCIESGTIWKHIHFYYNSIDEALLGALGYKHDGSNSQFSLYASKMLGIVKGDN
jgi:hypothetical protein